MSISSVHNQRFRQRDSGLSLELAEAELMLLRRRTRSGLSTEYNRDHQETQEGAHDLLVYARVFVNRTARNPALAYRFVRKLIKSCVTPLIVPVVPNGRHPQRGERSAFGCTPSSAYSRMRRGSDKPPSHSSRR